MKAYGVDLMIGVFELPEDQNPRTLQNGSAGLFSCKYCIILPSLFVCLFATRRRTPPLKNTILWNHFCREKVFQDTEAGPPGNLRNYEDF